MDTGIKLSSLAQALVSAFGKKDEYRNEEAIHVNPFVSKVASWYERLRNVMEYREEEVIVRAAIERMLKRLLLLGGNAKTSAEPLIRELIWARYLSDRSVPVGIIKQVEEIIDRYLQLRMRILQYHKVSYGDLNEWIFQLLSSEIAHVVTPNRSEDAMSGFMFQILKDYVQIADDSEETKQAQVYIAVRRAFARDDEAFLRYHMFLQLVGTLTEKNIDIIARDFPKTKREIIRQIKYPRRDRIYTFIKRNAAPFLILSDAMQKHADSLQDTLVDPKKLEKAVVESCRKKYAGTSIKVRRAIIRSVLFILLTKFIFAFLIEGTYERIVYGGILWNVMLLNIGIPPLLMIVASLFITTPGSSNTKKIYSYIQAVLYEEHPKVVSPLVVKRKRDTSQPILSFVFRLLWIFAFVVSFGAIIYVLTILHFNLVSQAVFLFFLTIVSFLTYRIGLTADTYRLGERQHLFTPFFDFLFMPIVSVGRTFTQGISQINIVLFIFDLVIETPFKVTFAFVEQWFYFLHSKREEME